MQQQQQRQSEGAAQKQLTAEEIRKIAPGYREKPENFDASKVGKPPVQRKKTLGPKSPNVTPPTLRAQTVPTPQRNESIIS